MTFSKEYNKHVEDLLLINVATFPTVYGEDYDKWGEGEYWVKTKPGEGGMSLRKGDLVVSPGEGFLLLIVDFVEEKRLRESVPTRSKVVSLRGPRSTLGDDVQIYDWTVLRNFQYLYHVPTRDLLDGTATAIAEARKDFCYDCKNDNLYWHAMTAKCNQCHQIIMGG